MPKPTSPVLPGQEHVIYGENQPQYNPLPAIRHSAEVSCPATSRWVFTPEERAAIADGADLYLTSFTFGGPIQPVTLQVLKESEAAPTLILQSLIPPVVAEAAEPTGRTGSEGGYGGFEDQTLA